MRRKKKQRKSRPRKLPAPGLVIGGIQADAARTLVNGIVSIIKATKNNPELALEAIRALGNASESKPTTVTNCVFHTLGEDPAQ